MQIFKRLYVKTILLLFAFIFLALFAIFAGINDIKYEISTLNSSIKADIKSTFLAVKNDMLLRAKLIENGIKPFSDDSNASELYSAFYVISKDGALVYERQFDGVYNLEDYSAAWFSDVKNGEFRISDRFYKNKRLKDIYIAYGLKNGNKILIQLNQNF